MKIGFAVERNQGLDSPVYAHFGSAPAFVIFDTDSQQVSSLDNDLEHHVHGACNPVMALGGGKIDAMVVGGIGPGAVVKLNGMGVKVYRAAALTVKDNISLLSENRLREVSMEDSCQEHGGNCGH